MPRALPCPLRSAFRVWLPSWRLTPRDPVPVLFRTGRALGIYPSELSPSGRYPARFRVETPTYCFARRYTCTEGTGRLDRPQFLGFSPSGSPWQPNVVLARQPLDAPLGFAPLGTRRTPSRGFRPASSHALFRPRLFTQAAAPQSIDQCPLRLALFPSKLGGSSEAPFWGFRTGLHPEAFEHAVDRAILFTLRHVAHCCRLTDAL